MNDHSRITKDAEGDAHLKPVARKLLPWLLLAITVIALAVALARAGSAEPPASATTGVTTPAG